MTHEHICIVGLGYVGLPLAHAFAAKGWRVTGYDVNTSRIAALENGTDATNELTSEQLQSVSMTFTSNPEALRDADYIIVALPTPVDAQNKPDISILKAASQAIGKYIQTGAIVIFESTVYPGTTEDICGPIIEQYSGKKSGVDFFLGYSPERINPGDKVHTVASIVKIVSGQNEHITQKVAALYASIVLAGVHIAPSIQVAEMAKAIENAQRDLNIAFMNEVAILCNAIGIATSDVLAAAKTKWNFLPFQPGLVGGHCIGVDPYYLVEKATQLGIDSKVITAGRSLNDSMAEYIATQIHTQIADLPNPTVLLLGVTFKENVPDTRNSKVQDVYVALQAKGCQVFAHDPFYTPVELERIGYTPGSMTQTYSAVALLVPHAEYIQCSPADIERIIAEHGLLYDLKSIYKDYNWQNVKYKSL